MKRQFLGMVFAIVLLAMMCGRASAADKVTILYDAFGDSKMLTKDWGFSALVEHDGKRILFDTGSSAAVLEHNAKAAGVDLAKVDFVVISHRHTDHANGLAYVLKVNPAVPVYVPADGFNGFGGIQVPSSFFRPVEDMPTKMRYFEGKYPASMTAGKLYETANVVLVSKLTEVAPGVFVVPTVSQKKGSLELPELTLAIKRPNGLLLLDGCSHAGIETILEAASVIDPRTEIVFGGLHLVTTPVEEIDALVTNLQTKWKVHRIAPGHCTGEPAFARLQKAYGEKYVYAGLGTTVVME